MITTVELEKAFSLCRFRTHGNVFHWRVSDVDFSLVQSMLVRFRSLFQLRDAFLCKSYASGLFSSSLVLHDTPTDCRETDCAYSRDHPNSPSCSPLLDLSDSMPQLHRPLFEFEELFRLHVYVFSAVLTFTKVISVELFLLLLLLLCSVTVSQHKRARHAHR